MQLESRAERTEENVCAMMGLLRTFIFIGSPQITSVSVGFIYLVDTTYKKHPVSMNMASSFEVHFLRLMYLLIILTIIFSNSMILFEHYFSQAVFKARSYDDI